MLTNHYLATDRLLQERNEFNDPDNLIRLTVSRIWTVWPLSRTYR